jgi:hypothetical protein
VQQENIVLVEQVVVVAAQADIQVQQEQQPKVVAIFQWQQENI